LGHSAFIPVLALVLVGAQVGLAKQVMEIVKESLAKGNGINYTFYAAHPSGPACAGPET